MLKTIIYKIKKQHPDARFIIHGERMLAHYRVGSALHNAKGPAVLVWHFDGVLIYQSYWTNDALHNTEGPAIRQWDDDAVLVRQEYWLKGQRIK